MQNPSKKANQKERKNIQKEFFESMCLQNQTLQEMQKKPQEKGMHKKIQQMCKKMLEKSM